MQELPIAAKKAEIIGAVRENRVVLIKGETGSGKTTQLPIMLLQAKFARSGSVIVVEPRRAAAINVAERVAQQLGEPLGKHVGYHVRFENVGGKETSVKFVTAGILLKEILRNPLLVGCSVLVIDEVHESSVENDLLMSLASDIVKRRPGFRMILMSATMDVSKYSSFFDGIPVIDIPGRRYPIDIHYLRRDLIYLEQFIDEAVEQTLKILKKGGSGDILIFMPGRESIEAVIDLLTLKAGRQVIALPLYRDLEPSEQRKVYQSFPGLRKVVVATNIAETSITIENIRYVIDSGLIKNTAYLNGVQCLLVEKHSQSGCDQRSGRSGRVGPGICFRMFTEESFKDRPLHSIPEIERADPTQAMLYLHDSGRNMRTARFIHRPPDHLIADAERNLITLGAISEDGRVTQLGKHLANLPVEPHVGNLIMESVKYGCVREVLTFVSFLSRTGVFLRPYGKVAIAEKRHALFLHPTSDALTMLNVWNGYCGAGYSREWCRENFINIHAVEEAKKVRDQLARILLRWKFTISRGSEETFLKCLVSGLRFNLLRRNGDGYYHGVFRNVQGISMLPQSLLRTSKPQYVVAADLLKVKNCYALYVTETKVEWLRECVPHFETLAAPVPLTETSNRNEKERSKAVPTSIIHRPDSPLVMLAFMQEGDTFVTEYGGERILKTNKGGKVEVGKPYKCRIIEILGVHFAEVVAPGPIEKKLGDDQLTVMAEELATAWQCHFKGE